MVYIGYMLVIIMSYEVSALALPNHKPPKNCTYELLTQGSCISKATFNINPIIYCICDAHQRFLLSSMH